MLVGAAAGAPEGATACAVERRLFDRGYLAAVVSGDGVEPAAIACAEAGVIAVCALPRLAATALVERLGAERVVLVGGGSPEEIAAEAMRGLTEKGVV